MDARPISRLAIVNRGAPAMRFVRAAREHAREHGRDLRLIAVHTEAERDALVVRAADEAVSLGGPSSAPGGVGSLGAGPPDLERIEASLAASGADAAWAGWGPLAQLPEFADLCERLGILKVGPSSDTLRRITDPVSLAALAADAGVPLADPASLAGGYPRHLEVLTIADHRGTAWAVDVHDGTLQRRTEKVLVETSSGAIAGVDDRWLRAVAARLMTLAGFAGGGTVTFVRPPDRNDFALLRISAGIPLGHGITEMTHGIDVAKLQLHVAEGGRLEGAPPSTRGHAMSVRLNAEDAEAALSPSPGRVDLLQLPSGPGIRVDTGITEGSDLAAGPDPTVAELVAWGRDREEARVRLHLALTQLVVVLDGGTTSKGFLLDLLERTEVATGAYDTGWLDRVANNGGLSGVRHADLALLVAAVDAYDLAQRYDRAQLFASASRGRPRTASGVGRTVELVHRGRDYAVQVARTGRRRYELTVDGVSVELQVTRLSPYQSRVELGQRSMAVVSAVQGGDYLVELDGVPHRLRARDGGMVRSPSPGVIVSLSAQAGDEVAAGESVAVLESMKMERAVPAPFAGRVRRVLAGTNVQVDTGAPLVELDPLGAPPEPADATRLEFTPAPPPIDEDPAERRRRDLDALRRFVLGYDIGPDQARRLATDQARQLGELGTARDDLLGDEIRALGAYADVRALFRSHRESEEIVEDPLLVRSPQEHLHAYMRSVETGGEGLPARFLDDLDRALARYGVTSRARSRDLDDALYWVFRSQARRAEQVPVVVALLQRWYDQGVDTDRECRQRIRMVLDRLVSATQRTEPQVADLAREVRYRLFEAIAVEEKRLAAHDELDGHVQALRASELDEAARAHHLDAVVSYPTPLAPLLLNRVADDPGTWAGLALELLTRRYYRLPVDHALEVGEDTVVTSIDEEPGVVHTVAVWSTLDQLGEVPDRVRRVLDGLPEAAGVRVDVCTACEGVCDEDAFAERAREALAPLAGVPGLRHATVASACLGSTGPDARVNHVTFHPGDDGQLVDDRSLRGLQPMMARRLKLWRYANFDLHRLPSADGIYLFRGTAWTNPKDERLFAVAEVRTLTPRIDDEGRIRSFVEVEWALTRALDELRRVLAATPMRKRPVWNRITLHIWPVVEVSDEVLNEMANDLAPTVTGLGLERVEVSCWRPHPDTGEVRERSLGLTGSSGTGFSVVETDVPAEPLVALDEYAQKVVQSRRRGTPYPYELVKLLTARGVHPASTGGHFEEHDLDEHGRLVPVDRPPGQNRAGVVVGLVTNTTARYPEGITRVVILGDPTRALGAITMAECDRISAALDLAEQRGIPAEWFALSAGARIALDSGTENMDGVGAVLRRLIEFTQAGHEINVVVTGINVGAQPYWNAEATMLMHTRGILVMTPDSAMVLTGKQALDFSGSVSAEDNYGIGGYERVMGPNGQAQYWAPDLPGACRVLLSHYQHAYVAPGERFPRRALTSDPTDRDVRTHPHRVPGMEFVTVGDVFDDERNPGRKKPFDIRTVMRAVLDADHEPMERWADLADGDTAAVWDAHLGGIPVCAIGLEAHAIPRRGIVPADGPEQWTSGTLFPMSSWKVARAVNAASGSRPLLVLANLSGFDGSPESMRRRQLEFGAEIGRAVTNFKGPIVFCVVSRYHGGAFVVFSQKLHDNLVTLAVEGAHASVIGGAPAAAVVFAGEVNRRTRADERIKELEAEAAGTSGAARAHLRTELAALTAVVRSEKLGELATEFDRIHSVQRAQQVGSVTAIIPANELRPQLIRAVEQGMARDLEQLDLTDGAAATVHVTE